MQTYSELHQAARNYAEAGIPIFPVEVNGKKPLPGSNGFYDATTDLQKINAWWSKADYNLAFSPGDCGLVVVDLDPGAELELPATYTVRTPRGRHYYFEGEGPTTASKVAPHVDTRGLGGYVLLPPSSIAGRKYELIKPLPYAPLPSFISEALSKPDIELKAAVSELDLPINVGRAENLLRKYVDDGNVAIEGQGGDEHTYRICCELLDFGLSTDTALRLLEEQWNPSCVPPWSVDELSLKLQNASAYQQNEAGSRAIEDPQKVFGAIVEKLFPVKRSRFYFKDEDEQENEPDPQWILKDVVTERSTVLLYGPTQSYKSFLAVDIALGVSTCTETFGSVPLSGPVFYAALEGKAHLKKARRAWKIARGVEGKIKDFYLGVAPIIGIANEVQEFGDEIRKRCGDKIPRLIIIDTLGKSMAGLNENDARDAGNFIQFCDSLVEHFGCSVIAIHHSGKDQTKGARGSSAFHAGFDTVIEVNAHRANKAVSVWVRKHKDAEERETPWTFEGRVVGGSLAFFPTNAKEHHSLTHEENEYAPRKIGAALQGLSAYGTDKAVTTNVLAKELTPRVESQAEDDYQNAVARAARALHKAGKEFLEAYTVRVGKQIMWALPEPMDKKD